VQQPDIRREVCQLYVGESTRKGAYRPLLKSRAVDGRNKSGHESMRKPDDRVFCCEDKAAFGIGTIARNERRHPSRDQAQAAGTKFATLPRAHRPVILFCEELPIRTA